MLTGHWQARHGHDAPLLREITCWALLMGSTPSGKISLDVVSPWRWVGDEGSPPTSPARRVARKATLYHVKGGGLI